MLTLNAGSRSWALSSRIKRLILPSPYLEGVAVYPFDVMHTTVHWRDDLSWTLACAPDFVPLAANSPLFRHLWGEKDKPPTFAENNIPGTNVFCLRQLPPEAVMFHRNKDGSLIRLLRQRMGILSKPMVQRFANRSVMRVVSLRRAGDIIAIIPALWNFRQKGRSVHLVVHSDFVPLFDGISYIQSIEWKGDWENPLAASRAHGAINAQVYGKGVKRAGPSRNFVVAAWDILKVPWNRYLPLDFDRRDYQRESKLAESLFHSDKPKVLIKLHGFSSPFPHTDFIWQNLRKEFGEEAELVNLDTVKADRLYDLLGLMDRAACLISSDTVTLHLNRGHKIPTIAFINGGIWGSSPRVGNCVLRLSYGEVPAFWPKIASVLRTTILSPPNENIVLAFSQWTPKDDGTRQRHRRAFDSWSLLGARLLPYVGERDSSIIGDHSKMPFICDMINASAVTGSENIIALTNNDIVFDPELRESVVDSCRKYGCFWAYRLDTSGRTDNGVDFVAFTRQWWDLHLSLFPDFIMGCTCWDDIMARIMQWSGCRECERLYYHENHPLAAIVRANTPGIKYAERLGSDWIKKYGEPKLKPVDYLQTL